MMRIGIYVFDQVEVLDFAGPYEVFTTAARVHARMNAAAQPERTASDPLFSVTTIGFDQREITARAGLKIRPDESIDQHPALDILVVAGGVVNEELKRDALAAWLRQQATQVRILASVCTGAMLLGRAGLLDGLAATTHWEDLQDLAVVAPACVVKQEVRWVDSGDIVTSAGISAGIDMCLHLVERVAGRALALATARQMEFDWTENKAPRLAGSPAK